jgi:hypothetical protein
VRAVGAGLDRHERRGGDEQRVVVVDVVGADGELVGVQLVVDLDRPATSSGSRHEVRVSIVSGTSRPATSTARMDCT